MDTPTTTRVSVDVSLGTQEAFDTAIGDLATALARNGFRLEEGPTGRIVSDDLEVGSVRSWEPGERVVLEWRPTTWDPAKTTELAVEFEAIDDGARITVEHRGWDRVLEEPDDLVGWFASEVARPFVVATSPDAVGEWLTDRRGRRPTGTRARREYGDPLYHYPNFRVILAELALTAEDVLLEVGCGGGALLGDALESGCRAAAVDHSPEMVALARDRNRTAVDDGRLEVREANAEALPFPDGTFSCATMTGVLGHLPDPEAVFQELHRVLAGDGRIVIAGSDPELKGTPAAPEPMASRMHFYDGEGLEDLALEAGFEDVRVLRREMEPYAREVGIPDEHLPLFTFPARFLLARKLDRPR